MNSRATWYATVSQRRVRDRIRPRHVSYSTNPNAAPASATATTPTAANAFPCIASTPTTPESHRNGPLGRAAAGSAGLNGDPGVAATVATNTNETIDAPIANPPRRDMLTFRL